MVKPSEESLDIIRRCYRKVLKREPDRVGIAVYSELLKEGKIDEKKLEKILYKSEEYKNRFGFPEDKIIQEKVKKKHKTSERLKILWICNDNTANGPYTVCKGINKYTEHKALLIQAKRTYLKYPIDGTVFCDKITSKEFLKIVSDFDIIHLNEPVVEGSYPPVSFFADGKKVNLFSIFSEEHKVFRHANGTYYRRNHKEINKLCYKLNIYQTVSTPDLLSLGKNLVWRPQPLLLDDKLLSFSPPVFRSKILISHSPTNREIKGTDMFIKICKDYFPDIEIKLLEFMPNEECLKEKRKCHLHYDQFSLGAYGVSSLEGLAMGQITLVGLKNVEKYLPEHKFINLDGSKKNFIESLEKAITILKNEKKRKKWLLEGRKWVEKYHDVKNVIKGLIYLYKHADFWCG